MGTTGQSITLANSIIGVGILAMPFCFQQCGVLLATVILITMGLVSRLCCHFLLKSALLARRRNFEFLAFHVFGSAGKMAVEVGIIGFLMGTCIAYFVVVGDLGPQIIAKMFNINQSDILRTSIMVIVSLVCVLPLGLLRNVDSLSNVSAATIGFYFCLVLKVITEAASQLLSGDWQTRLEMWKPSGVLQCVPIFSMALFCQTQLFEIFESMPLLSLEKMNVVAKNAINICTGVYFTLGVFGYIAFNSQIISGNILMSLSPTMASDVIKLGFVMSLAFSFPLIIFPCRASLYSFLYKKVHSSHHDHTINNSIPESSFRCITVAIIAVALFVSLLIPNIELVLGLVGSTIGVLVCVVFPAACFLNVTFKNTNERILAKAVLVLGLVIMVLGTYANLQAAETRPDKYDDKITQERIDKIVEDFFEKMEKSEGKQNVIPKNKIKEVQVVDSEIQPPNPVPPESVSNEKKPIVTPDKVEKKLEIKQENVVAKAKADKESESHPRNLKNKLLNEANRIANEEINLEKEKSLIAEEIVENKIEQPKEEKEKTPSNEEKVQQKIDMMKQQQLIETIKQHGEEQKELIKEQKELLVELIKTKQELQQNKKEVDSDETKKIAVESIKKIADMAIQSLSGVSDKPAGQHKEKKDLPLEKIANEAVNEIAKKAVETIESIKEVKEKPKEPAKPNHVDLLNGNVVQAQPVNNVVNPVPQQNVIPNQEVSGNKAKAQPVNNIPNQIPIQNNVQNVPVVNPVPVQSNVATNQKVEPVNQNPQQNVKVIPAASINQDRKDNQVPANHPVDVNPKPNAQPSVIPKTAVKPQESIPNVKAPEIINQHEQNENLVNQVLKLEQAVKQPVPKLNPDDEKSHSHSPGEPQSYKQVEDLQEKVVKEHLNVAAPIAMNGNSQSNKVEQNNIVKTEQLDAIAKVDPAPLKTAGVIEKVDNLQNNGAKDINNNLDTKIADTVPVRQKREVVYCTEKMLLNPEDRKICKSLIVSSDNKISEDTLSSNVNVDDVVLPKSLPLDTVIHHLRSLKSYDENEKR